MTFIPHTPTDEKDMLSVLGLKTAAELFQEVPEHLRKTTVKHFPARLCEMESAKLMQQRADQDRIRHNFIGAGAYEHHIPALIGDLASRGEWLTAYTPYQAEASQGTLQLLYEYQTMMSRLMAMDVSNASLYDGATALVEAVLMALRLNKRSKRRTILCPATLSPMYYAVLQTYAKVQNIKLLVAPYDLVSGRIDLKSFATFEQQDLAAVVIPQPNFLGVLEAVDDLTNWAHQQGALVIGQVNPLSMAWLKPPGDWGVKGADLVCGEAQPLGMPLNSGGPYMGFLCARHSGIRQLPGRLVGKTVDLNGKPGYTLTLQAREQHIRRSKATSNICTNQGLMVLVATLYMSVMGGAGMRAVAKQSHQKARYLKEKLQAIDGVNCLFSGSDFFHEFVCQLPKPVDQILEKLRAMGIEGGFDLSHTFSSLKNPLLICVTEKKTREELDFFAQQMEQLIHADF